MGIKKEFGIYAVKFLHDNSCWKYYQLLKAFSSKEAANEYMEKVIDGTITKHNDLLKVYNKGLCVGKVEEYENMSQKL